MVKAGDNMVKYNTTYRTDLYKSYGPPVKAKWMATPAHLSAA